MDKTSKCFWLAWAWTFVFILNLSTAIFIPTPENMSTFKVAFSWAGHIFIFLLSGVGAYALFCGALEAYRKHVDTERKKGDE